MFLKKKWKPVVKNNFDTTYIKVILQHNIYWVLHSQGLQPTPLPCRPLCFPPSALLGTPAGQPEAVRSVSSTESVSALWASPAPPPPHRKAPFCPSAHHHRQRPDRRSDSLHLHLVLSSFRCASFSCLWLSIIYVSYILHFISIFLTS